MIRTASLVIALGLSVLCATAAVAQDDPCLDGGKWSFGGAPNTPAGVAALVKGTVCAGVTSDYCKLTDTAGITYVLSVPDYIAVERRAVTAGEQLPFGILTGDTPQEVLKKIQRAGQRAGYGRTMFAHPASVGLFCGTSDDDFYLLEFVYNAAGHMTGLSQTAAHNGGMYVDDVTKSFAIQDE